MKFQKTAIAVTIAGFAAAPMMASADTVLSGVVQVKYQGTDADDDEVDMAAGDVRVAIASEHEISSGLIGYGNLQLNLDDLTGQGGLEGSGIQADVADEDGSITDEDIVELTSSATVSSDNVYVGVKGGFGDVRFGEIPLAVEYGQLANDIHDVGVTVAGGASYTGTFGPVGLGLNHSPAENSDMFGAGIKFNFAGATIGLGFEDRDEKANFAIGASYAIAGVSLAVHYWASELDFGDLIDVDDDDDGVTNITLTDVDFDDVTNFAVQVGYTIAGVSLGLTYSVLNIDGGFGITNANVPAEAALGEVTGDQAIIRFDAGYDLGGGLDISTRIQSTTDEIDGSITGLEDDLPFEDSDDLVEYRVMLTKTF